MDNLGLSHFLFGSSGLFHLQSFWLASFQFVLPRFVSFCLVSFRFVYANFGLFGAPISRSLADRLED